MKKIIVFGASGDTGQYFVKYFLEHYIGEEYQIVATGTRETHYLKNMKFRIIELISQRKRIFLNCPKMFMR